MEKGLRIYSSVDVLKSMLPYGTKIESLPVAEIPYRDSNKGNRMRVVFGAAREIPTNLPHGTIVFERAILPAVRK